MAGSGGFFGNYGFGLIILGGSCCFLHDGVGCAVREGVCL